MARSCPPFSIVVPDVGQAVAKARLAIADGGGQCIGDDRNGIFAGRSALGQIEGSYTSDGWSTIEITITHKPWLVPCRMIESRVRGYFS